MGTFLNSHWWVGDLTLFEAPAGGAFDHLNCQHTGEFDQNFSKKSNARTLLGGVWTFLEFTGILYEDQVSQHRISPNWCF